MKSCAKTKSPEDAYISNKKISKIEGVTTSLNTKLKLTKAFIKTKASFDEIIIPDTLLYVITFEDGGFAVISAYSRIDASILAVTESGNLSPDDFVSSNELYDNYSIWGINYYGNNEEDEDDFDGDIEDDGEDDDENEESGSSSGSETGEKPYWDVPTPSDDELTVRYRFRVLSLSVEN